MCGHVQQEPYTMEGETPGVFVGFIPDLMYQLSQRLNFDYEFHLSKKFGWRAENDTWYGMIGEVMANDVSTHQPTRHIHAYNVSTHQATRHTNIHMT